MRFINRTAQHTVTIAIVPNFIGFSTKKGGSSKLSSFHGKDKLAATPISNDKLHNGALADETKEYSS